MEVSLFMQISDMKKFILKIICFVLCMVVVDCLFGSFFAFLQSHAKGGSTRVNYYLSEDCGADILVLGCSRARYHYVPHELDSLGGVAYNAGHDGMGIILGLGRYQLCLEKHNPKIVIVDIYFYDYFKDDNSKYLKLLRPFANKPEIERIFTQVGEPFIQIKNISNMYRNTSEILQNLIDVFSNRHVDERGYRPLFGNCEKCISFGIDGGVPSVKLDSAKMEIFDQFVEESRSHGTKLFFAISPSFYRDEKDVSKVNKMYAEMLSKRYDVPLLDNEYIPGISNNPAMFSVNIHLNDEGAVTYTRKLVKDILELQNGTGVK